MGFRLGTYAHSQMSYRLFLKKGINSNNRLILLDYFLYRIVQLLKDKLEIDDTGHFFKGYKKAISLFAIILIYYLPISKDYNLTASILEIGSRDEILLEFKFRNRRLGKEIIKIS